MKGERAEPPLLVAVHAHLIQADERGLTAYDIAQRFGMSSGYARRLLVEIEQRGWAWSAPDAARRRRWWRTLPGQESLPGEVS